MCFWFHKLKRFKRLSRKLMPQVPTCYDRRIPDLECIIRENHIDGAVAVLNSTIVEIFLQCQGIMMHLEEQTKTSAINGAINGAMNGYFVNENHAMFHCIDPVLNLNEYVQRLAQHTGASASAILNCCALLRRFSSAWVNGDANATLYIPLLSNDNAHKVVLAMFVTAIKITDDDHRNQAWLSECGGISTEDLFFLELNVLRGLDYRLICDLRHV